MRLTIRLYTFKNKQGNIMQTVLNTQYIQRITQCDVKFTYEHNQNYVR